MFYFTCNHVLTLASNMGQPLPINVRSKVYQITWSSSTKCAVTTINYITRSVPLVTEQAVAPVNRRCRHSSLRAGGPVYVTRSRDDQRPPSLIITVSPCEADRFSVICQCPEAPESLCRCRPLLRHRRQAGLTRWWTQKAGSLSSLQSWPKNKFIFIHHVANKKENNNK